MDSLTIYILQNTPIGRKRDQDIFFLIQLMVNRDRL